MTPTSDTKSTDASSPPEGDDAASTTRAKADQAAAPAKTRLARVIARSGAASRRSAEKVVQDGRVEVNGSVIWHPGHPVDPDRDHIRVDGKPLPKPPPLVYYLLFKPKGTITGRDDPGGRKSVLDLVEDLPHRVEPVGRLDFNTEGALLLTNDGDLAHKLTHPSFGVPKRYMAKVWRTPSERTLNRLRNGVMLEDGRSAPSLVRVAETTDNGNCWLEITVTEGKNRLVRRMLEAVGHPCNKLRRESFATLSIRGMDRGALRPLSAEEVARLQDIASGKDPAKAGHAFRYKKGFARPKSRPNKPLSRKKAARKRVVNIGKGTEGKGGGGKGGGGGRQG